MSEINGFLLLDKEAGISSNRALYPVKKLLPRGTKIGHTGTLDPGATGLLVLALGRATRFISYLKSGKKSYAARFRLGLKTDSADIWGNIIEEREPGEITEEDILRALGGFEGEIEQIPPMYSALKKDGRPLYELARMGISVERKPRKQFIYSIELLAFDYPEVSIRVLCDAGTYIRTLIEDIALSLGELAAMTDLRRLESDGFCIDRAIVGEDIVSLDFIESRLVTLDEAFSTLPALELDFERIVDLRNGRKPDLSFLLLNVSHEGLIRLMHQNKLYALLELNEENHTLTKILWTVEGLYV